MTRAAVHQIVRHAIVITGFRDLAKHTVTLREEQIDQAADRIIDDLALLADETSKRREAARMVDRMLGRQAAQEDGA